MRELQEHCKNHPILDADGRCATCWGYFCDACLDDIGEHRYCEKCAPAAQAKVDAEIKAQKQEELKKLDLRLLMYTLIILLGVVIGGSIIMMTGGIEQFFETYVPNYQVINRPKSLDSKVLDFDLVRTEHFNVYYHNADLADAIIRPLEERYRAILSNLLIYDKDVMQRGPFNILIVADDAELKSLFDNILPNRVAMTDYETKSIIIVEANEQGNALVNVTHELAHAIFFERMKGGNKIPNWVQEGLASYEESRFDTSQTDARWATFGPDIVASGGLPLKDLVIADDASPEEVSFFYAESLSAVQYMVNNHGMLKFMTFASKMQSGTDIDTALRETYDKQITGLEDLQIKWLESLRV